ncbi:CRISPR-associated endonuclease Cas2 [candidate division KSB1 bacterium]|nr:CRISPR-associated endonuclease Cas2 [candidate division KSB1 bacterium]
MVAFVTGYDYYSKGSNYVYMVWFFIGCVYIAMAFFKKINFIIAKQQFIGYIMFVNVSYDIENDKTRTRIAHKIKDFGQRVQKSVFEADVSKEEFKKLNKMLAAVKLGKNDRSVFTCFAWNV